MTQSIQTKLAHAEQELRSLLLQTESGASIDGLVVSPETEQLTHFNQEYQARKVASAVIDPEELKSVVRSDILTELNNILALEDEFAVAPTEQASAINYDRADTRYAHKIGTADLLTQRIKLFLATEVGKGVTPDESDEVPAETWIPLQTLAGKSSSELTRIILRTIPVDEQLDVDITDLLAGLVQGAATDPDALPIMEQSGLDRSYDGLQAIATSQAFREAVGPTLAPLLGILIEHGEIGAYDQTFRQAYDAVLQFTKAQAMTTPKTTEQATQEAAPAQPIVATPPTTPPTTAATSVPVRSTPAAQVPLSAPGNPAPTIDFRHPDQAPPAPENPAADQSRIKPINIQ